jgi:hypothetical protein
MSSSSEKFNFLTVLFSVIFVFSVFSCFSDSLGVNIVSFVIVAVTFIFSFNSFKSELKNYLLPVSSFVLVCVISYYFADFKYNVRNEMFLLFSVSGIYLLSGFLGSEERKKLLIISILTGLWLTIYIFSSLFSLSKHSYVPSLTGYMDCATCSLLSALSLSFAFWKDKKRIYVCIPFIFFLAVVMTRSLFAICIASFIFSTSLFVLYGSIKKKIVAIFALIGAASFYFLLKTSFFSDKLLVWKTALAVIRDNFLLGVGFNNYKSVSLSYGILENVDFLYCDNIFLQILAESGVVGFTFFLAILAFFLFFVIKKIKLEKDKKAYFFVLIAVISFMVYNFFNSTSFVSTNMLLFFFLLSFPLPVYGVEKRKKRFNDYILSVLCLLLILVSGVPLYARQEYKKGLSFFASNHFMQAKDCFIEALGSDCLNPEYAGRLSDIYFAMYQKNKNRFLLEKAVK